VATLSVWKFEKPDGASQALRTVKDLNNEGLIVLQDAAYVEWPEGAKKPKTHQLQEFVGPYALGGAFWGFLFGLLFFIPFLGIAIGAAAGAGAGALRDVGIDDDFIKKVKESVTPGTSALFLLTSSAVQDRVRQRFIGTQAELIYTNLSEEEEGKLRHAFGED
jgi:uncharacterized membrane protein